MNILIVEPALAVAESVYLFFREFHPKCKVKFALTLAESLSMLRKEKPDIILVDTHMEEVDAVSKIVRYVETQWTLDTPRIYLTSTLDDVKKPYGVVGIIPKPYPVDMLAALARC